LIWRKSSGIVWTYSRAALNTLFQNSKFLDALRVFVAATIIALAAAWQAAPAFQKDDQNLKDLTKTKISSVSRSDTSRIKIPDSLAAFPIGSQFTKF
jgi:hypothetical protein